MKLSRKLPRYFWLMMISAACLLLAYFLLPQNDNETLKEQDLQTLFHATRPVVFEPVLPGKELTFPEDFAQHLQYQHEWWRYFATLTDDNGQLYGVQWSFSRIATDNRNERGWRNPHLYYSHIVITSQNDVWRQQRIARAGIGQAGINLLPFRLMMDNWNWRSVGRLPLPGLLSVETDNFSVQLSSTALSPLVLDGDHGYSLKHDLLPLATYSVKSPFLKVAGRLELNGQQLHVTGDGWLEKEWGSDLLTEQAQTSALFSLRLDEGRILTVQRVGVNQSSTYTRGLLADDEGTTTSLSGDMITLTPLEYITLKNGKLIPLKWTVKVPDHDIELTVRALNNEQWHPFFVTNWEGPVISAGMQPVSGFLQLTGY
jgi:predicted secreted hydrolase